MTEGKFVGEVISGVITPCYSISVLDYASLLHTAVLGSIFTFTKSLFLFKTTKET